MIIISRQLHSESTDTFPSPCSYFWHLSVVPDLSLTEGRLEWTPAGGSLKTLYQLVLPTAMSARFTPRRPGWLPAQDPLMLCLAAPWGTGASIPMPCLVMQLPSGHQVAPSPNCQDTLLIHSPPHRAFQSLLPMFLPSDTTLPGLVRRQDPPLWLSPTLAFPPALTCSPQPSWQGPRRGGSGYNSRAGLLALLSQMICSQLLLTASTRSSFFLSF